MGQWNYAAIIAGALMVLAGAFLTISFIRPQLWGGWGWMVLLGPTMLMVGLVGCVRGFFGVELFSRRNLLIAGMTMVVLGAYPWAYVGLLFGGRPGNESEGMLGTLMFIVICIPGIFLTIVSFFRSE